MVRRTLSTPWVHQAKKELDFQAEPYDWADPIHWGGSPLLWRIVQVGDQFVVQGLSREEFIGE